MIKSLKLPVFAATLIFLFSAFFYYQKSQKPIHLQWVVAHGPRYVIEAGVAEFQRELDRLAPGRFIVDFQEVDGGSPEKFDQLLKRVTSGEIEIAQVYTPVIGVFDPRFFALDIPFLFENHEHAYAFMDSHLAEQMLASLDHAQLKGLAFTYSGGYRVIAAANKKIENVRDFENLKVRISGGSRNVVTSEAYRLLGAEGMAVLKSELDGALERGQIDAYETVYPRALRKDGSKEINVVNETFHSLHTTVVVIGKKTFDGIPDELKPFVTEAAHKAAFVERQVAVKEGEKAKAALQRKGVKIVTMADSERKKLKERFSRFGEKFPNLFSADLVSEIRNLSRQNMVKAE